jgi:hypothetical protein
MRVSQAGLRMRAQRDDRTKSMTGSTFERAVQLTDHLYTHAVIHCIAERIASEWHNLYTSVVYGREIDLLSVPDEWEHGAYGQDIVCLRRRLTRADAQTFVNEAQLSSVLCDAWTIHYAFEESVVGFRPAGIHSDLSDDAFWHQSIWSREWIGNRKMFNGEDLSRSNAWRIAEYLSCLEEARWSGIPLRLHPEKLGDLDETYPSPYSIAMGADDGQSSVRIEAVDQSLLDSTILTTGTLMRDDLIIRAIHLVGEGPLRIEEDFNAMNLLLIVDGIPMDAQAHRFIRGMSMSTAIYGKHAYEVPAAGRRTTAEKFLIPQRDGPRPFIGTPRASAVRNEAWIIGRLFRSQSQPEDAERFYNPGKDRDATWQAYRDLQQCGSREPVGEIVVADPYALDARAMQALGVMAIRENRVNKICVLTQFEPIGGDPITRSEKERAAQIEARNTAREKEIRRTQVEAQKVASAMKVTISFYRIESLHDRFLQIGDRLWHVGCSFNQLGQEITAIVEMRDERVKYEAIETFKKLRKEAPVFEVHP